jgi:hypothetical protein
MNIPLALRLLECGLPRFTLIGEDSGLCGFDCNGWEVELEVGDTTDYERIRYQCVQTDDGPRLLPDTTDPLLTGWLIAEIERHPGYENMGIYPQRSGGCMVAPLEDVGNPFRSHFGADPIEALISALEAALAAGKVAR